MALFRSGGGLTNPVVKVEINMQIKVYASHISNGAEVSGSPNTVTKSNNIITITMDHENKTGTQSFSKGSGWNSNVNSKISWTGTCTARGKISAWTIQSVTFTFKDGSTITL